MAQSASLRSEDYQLALDCAAQLADLSAVRDEQGFHMHVAQAVAPLIDATWTASERYTLDAHVGGDTKVGWQAGTIIGGEVSGVVTEKLYEAFRHTAHEHAGLQEVVGRREASVVTMEVYEKRGRALKDLALYHEFYRHLDVTDQIGVDVPLDASRHLTVGLGRDRPFTGREVQRLALIRDTVIAVSRMWRKHWDPQAVDTPRARMESLGLPPRLARLVPFLMSGLGQKQIAQQMGLSYHTVRSYTKELYGVMGVGSREELVAKVRDEALRLDQRGERRVMEV